jgi:hypothetical protein
MHPHHSITAPQVIVLLHVLAHVVLLLLLPLPQPPHKLPPRMLLLLLLLAHLHEVPVDDLQLLLVWCALHAP